MTDEQINAKAFEAYPNLTKEECGGRKSMNNANAIQSIKRQAYIKAIQESETLPKIKGWVTKTNEGDTVFHTTTAKPEKGETCWFGNEGDAIIDTESHLFPELTFNDEPIEVELIIRQIK